MNFIAKTRLAIELRKRNGLLEAELAKRGYTEVSGDWTSLMIGRTFENPQAEEFPISLEQFGFEGDLSLKAGRRRQLYRFGIEDLDELRKINLAVTSRNQEPFNVSDIVKIQEAELKKISDKYKLEYNAAIYSSRFLGSREIFGIYRKVDGKYVTNFVSNILDAWEEVKQIIGGKK